MAAHRIEKQRRSWLGMPLRLVALVVAALAVFGAVAGVALAYWTSTGSGAATATTGTLNAPTAVSGVQTSGTGTVVVSWTASTGSPSPSGYYVTRKDSSNNVVAACGTSASSTTPGATCNDTAVPIGSYTYTVIAIYHSWTGTSSPSSTVTVAQASQSISIDSAPNNPVVNGPTYTLTATGGGSGNPVVFSSSSTACTVSGSTVTFPHAGGCTINANQAGSTYYSAAPQAQQTFTVGKASQTVAFTSIAPTSAVVGGASYTVTASSGASGNSVTFSIDAATTNSACSIVGATVSFNHAGSCVVDANQVGNSDYLAANQVQQSIAVGQGTQALGFTSTPPSPALVGGTYTPTATSTANLTVAITLDATSTGCSLSSGVVTFAGVGTCKIDANQSGNADYQAAAQIQQSFTIIRQDQTVSINTTAPNNAKVGGATYAPTATANSGLAVTFTSSTTSVCTTDGTAYTFVAVGTCTVVATQSGNGTYNSATATQSFTVATGDQTITFTSGAPANAVNGGATYTASATASSGLTPVVFSSGSASVCTSGGTNGAVFTFVGAGTCVVNADQAGNTNWNAATQGHQSFSVGKASQSITLTSSVPTNATVGGGTYTASATASSGLTVSFSSGSASVCTTGGTNGATFTFVGAGTCVVNANQAGDANWNGAPQAQQTFSVAAAAGATKFLVSAASPQTAGNSFSVTITAQDASNNTVAAYTGNHTITFTTTAGSSPSGATATLPGSSVSFTNGVATVAVTLVKAETGRTITANDGTIQGMSSPINVKGGSPASLALATCTVNSVSGPCTSPFSLNSNGQMTAFVQALDSLGNAATITTSLPISVASGNTTNYSVTSGASLAIDGSATPANQTTASFTVKHNNTANNNTTITVASSGLPNLTFTVQK
jgi:hypothetical protein